MKPGGMGGPRAPLDHDIEWAAEALVSEWLVPHPAVCAPIVPDAGSAPGDAQPVANARRTADLSWRRAQPGGNASTGSGGASGGDMATAPQGTVERMRVVFGAQRQRRYGPRLEAVAFSPDGRLVAGAGGPDIAIWETETGRLAARFLSGGSAVTALAFSPDGARLAFVVGNREIRFATVAGVLSGERIADTPNGSYSLAYSSDGEVIAAAGWSGPTRLWSVRSNKLLRELPVPAGRIAFSPDGALALASFDRVDIHPGLALRGRTARKAPGRDGPVRVEERTGDAMAIAFSPDGTLGVASADGTVRFFDPATGAAAKRGRKVPGNRSVHGALSADLSRVAFADEGWVDVFDVAGGQRLPRAETTVAPRAPVALSPDGETLAIGGGDRTRLFAARAGGGLLWSAAVPGASALAFSPDGRLLAAGQDAIPLFDVQERSPAGSLALPPDGWSVAALCFSRNCEFLLATLAGAAGGGDPRGAVALYEVAAGRLVASVPHDSFDVTERVAAGTDAETTFAREPPVTAAALSADGGWLVSASETDLRRRRRSGDALALDRTLPVPALAAGYLPDGSLVTVDRKSARAWTADLRPGRAVELADVRCAAVCATRPLVAVASPERLEVRDLSTGRALPLAWHRGAVHALAFSAACDALATAGEDLTVVVWELSDRAATHAPGAR